MNTPIKQTLPANPYHMRFSSTYAWRWLLVAALGAGILISLVCRHFYGEARSQAEANLSIIAELKAHELERWLHDQRNGMMQPSSGALAQALFSWQSAKAHAEQDAALRETLSFYQQRHAETSRIDLYDASGNFLTSSDPTPPAAQRLPEADRPGGDQAGLVDFYLHGPTRYRLGFTIPLSLRTLDGPRTIGFALMEIDPTRYLYPFLQTWPLHSRSGETVLLRPAGDEADVLNPLARNNAKPLARRLNLRKAGLSAAQLSTTQTIIAPGLDYRGTAVLRVIHPVEGTPWKVSTKIDAAEVYAPALRSSLGVGLFTLTLFLACLLWLRQHHARVRAEARANALAETWGTLQRFIDHLPGTAYVKDHDSRVLIANAGFKTLLGLDPAAMIGKRSNEIFPGDFGDRMVADDLRVLAAGKAERVEESFNGRYYESTKFVIPLDAGRPALGGITLDVTQRHQAETQLRQREAQLRRLGDNLPEGFIYQIAQTADGTRRFLYASSGVERIFSFTAADLLADISLFFAQLDPAQLPAVREEQLRSLDGDFDMDLRMRRRDGSWGWINFHSRREPGFDENGSIIWNGLALDITRQRNDAAMLALQARRASALLALPAQADRLDEAAFMAHAQDVAEQLTGSQIAFIHFVNDDQESIELVAWSHNTLRHYCTAAFNAHYPISQAGLWADAARDMRPLIINDYLSHPHKHGLPEGHSPLIRLVSVPVIENGQIRMIAGVGNKAEDYTETDVDSVQLIANETWRIVRKRRAELALRQAVQVVEASPAVCFRWRLEPGWPAQYVSENVRRWGYAPAQLVAGTPGFAEMIHPDDLPRVGTEVDEHLANGRTSYTQEYRLQLASGDYIWVSDLTTVTRDEAGLPVFIDGVLTDISERKRHEDEITQALSESRALSKRLEEAHNQLLQSEKLAAIGQLAAGVAHELNNPIGFVHSNLGTLGEYSTALIEICDAYTTLIEDQHPDCPQLEQIRRIKELQDYNFLRADIFPLLEESREGLNRVRKIVQDLRDFSRAGKHDWDFADLHKGLDSTLNILANELKYKCTVRKAYGSIPEVRCAISQINQVFMNLLINAAQAIETTGEIVIGSGVEEPGQVWISIRDNGQGIPPELLNRIFEPFFTTKPVGVGTGLGLSLVFGIISRHKGRIDVSSTPGQGTEFRIVLPIDPPEAPASDAPHAPEAS